MLDANKRSLQSALHKRQYRLSASLRRTVERKRKGKVISLLKDEEGNLKTNIFDIFPIFSAAGKTAFQLSENFNLQIDLGRFGFC